jgi:hypothetical protein
MYFHLLKKSAEPGEQKPEPGAIVAAKEMDHELKKTEFH